MYKWNILSKYEDTQDVVNQILESRGFVSKKERDLFLNPPSLSYWYQNLPKELLSSLKIARRLVKKAIEEGKPIIVHGDYDVDGICATAILTGSLRDELGYSDVYPFIPNRFEHGYGLSEKSIKDSLGHLTDKQIEQGILFVTVDSGITSDKEVSILKSLGHEVIITDHHQKPQNLPNADVIVWDDQVVGSTLSWLLAKASGSKDEQLISYCSLATIADLQPVTDFNRTIVKIGLERLNSHPPLGIKALIEASGKSGEEITTYDLGWLLGPRLNASGRVEDASLSLNLLLEKDAEAAKDKAWRLNQVNSQRQDKTLEMYEIASGFDQGQLPEIIVSDHSDYHEGIIGLVASRLVKKYYRPAIVVSTSDKVFKGSVRSIPGFNIIEFLREMDELFLSLGGHPMAAGFSIEKDNFEAMKEKVKELAPQKINSDLFIRTLEVDLAIPANIINEKLVDSLDKLRPYGLGNSQPIFASFNLGVSNMKTVGKENQHLSLRLFDGRNFYRAILFNSDDFEIDFDEGDSVDIVYTLKKNTFNGNTYLDLILKDIQKSA